MTVPIDLKDETALRIFLTQLTNTVGDTNIIIENTTQEAANKLLEGWFSGTNADLSKLIKNDIKEFDTKIAELMYEVETNIGDNYTTIVNLESTVNDVENDLANNYATVTVIAGTYATLDTVGAMYTLRVTANGSVTGFKAITNGTNSAFIIGADYFKVTDSLEAESLTIFGVDTIAHKAFFTADVMIDGSLLVSESVTAGSIAAASIDTSRLTVGGSSVNLLTAPQTKMGLVDATVLPAGGGTVSNNSSSYIESSSIYINSSSIDCYMYLGKTSSDYNIAIPSGKKFLASCYFRKTAYNSSASESVDFFLVTSGGTHTVKTMTTPSLASEWVRLYAVIDMTSVPATQALLRFDSNGYSGYVQGFMLEVLEEGATDFAPSKYTPNGFNDGVIQSSNYAWSTSPTGFGLFAGGDPDSGSSHNIVGGSIYGGTIEGTGIYASNDSNNPSGLGYSIVAKSAGSTTNGAIYAEALGTLGSKIAVTARGPETGYAIYASKSGITAGTPVIFSDGKTTGGVARWNGFETNTWVEATLGYLPFTGVHISSIADICTVGDIMVVIKAEVLGISNIETDCAPSIEAKERNVFGVYSGSLYKKEKKLINSLGDGGINVCSEGGDIESGDYICSSNTKGKGMKQDDDLMHSYTVAKALEPVVWANEASNIKMIACIYHCG